MKSKTKKIKIVYIINSLEIGGAEMFCVDMLHALDRKVFEPYLICVMRLGKLADNLPQDITPILIGKKGKVGIFTILKIYQVLRSLKPDIAHTMLFGGDLWGRVACVLARVPKIFSTEQNQHTTDRAIEYLSKRILNIFTQKIIFISESVREYYLYNVPVEKSKTVIVPNGIQLQKYFLQRTGFSPSGQTIFIVVARLVEQKGHRYLIEALSQIEHLSWTCFLVGDGPLRESLEKQVEALNLTQRIFFLGERIDIPQLLHKSDAVVLPSVFEGQGIALLEGSASGCLVIASDTGGISEMFEHHKTAVFVAPKDSHALVQTLSWFIENKSKGFEIAQCGQRYVMENYSIEKTAQKYKELYLEKI